MILSIMCCHIASLDPFHLCVIRSLHHAENAFHGGGSGLLTEGGKRRLWVAPRAVAETTVQQKGSLWHWQNWTSTIHRQKVGPSGTAEGSTAHSENGSRAMAELQVIRDEWPSWRRRHKLLTERQRKRSRRWHWYSVTLCNAVHFCTSPFFSTHPVAFQTLFHGQLGSDGCLSSSPSFVLPLKSVIILTAMVPDFRLVIFDACATPPPSMPPQCVHGRNPPNRCATWCDTQHKQASWTWRCEPFCVGRVALRFGA